jgi:putative ABC transport system permease protein
MLNTQKKPTDDIHIRKALAFAFDYATVMSTIYQRYDQSKSVVPMILPGAVDCQIYNFNLTKAAEEIKLSKYYPAIVNSTSKAITDYFGNQVSVISATAVQSLLTTIFSTVSLFLVGIAAISLLVAGIGIMNIMIVSLIERTREIGILKALGMKSRTVLYIFLTESVIIGLIGAVIGIISGWVLANVVSLFLGRGGIIGSALTITPILTPEVLLGALGFGVGISVIFALYPAWRASKLKPVEALRYE